MPQKSATAQAKDGCQLFYRIYANPQKPRVALIHSLALSGAMWDEAIGHTRPSRGDSRLRLPRAWKIGAPPRPL